jgi:hypothetical protein
VHGRHPPGKIAKSPDIREKIPENGGKVTKNPPKVFKKQ